VIVIRIFGPALQPPATGVKTKLHEIFEAHQSDVHDWLSKEEDFRYQNVAKQIAAS
jgi:hypothetical protein